MISAQSNKTKLLGCLCVFTGLANWANGSPPDVTIIAPDLSRPPWVRELVATVQTSEALTRWDQDGEEEISLNGAWLFRTDPDGVAEKEKWYASDTDGWSVMPVPGNWDTHNAFAHYQGRAIYRRVFTIPEDWSNSHIRLKFEGVSQEAKVYVNNQYIGAHFGAYTPFEFTLNDLVEEDSENSITVIADNTFHRGAWWNWGGISRDVKLVRNKPVRIVRQLIDSHLDLNEETALVEVRIVVSNDAHEVAEAAVVTRLDAEKTAKVTWGPVAIPSQTQHIRLSPFETKTITQRFTLQADTLKLWHFDTPYLYQCHTEIRGDEGVLHRVVDRFGVRKIEVEGTTLLLNGEAIRANGFNRVSDHRAWGNTEPSLLTRSDADLLKNNGCVLTRLSHVPLSPELLDYLDEIGMLIIEEIPVWGLGDPHAYENSPTVRQWLREMIQRDYNHPCIIGWSVGNELALSGLDWKDMRLGPHHFAYIRSMIDYVKRTLDDSRLLTYASFTVFREQATPANDAATMCDIILVNCYGNAAEQVAAVHRKWPGKPIFMSEFGKGQIGLDPDRAVVKDVLFESMNAIRRDHDYVVGWSWWAFSDYRSRYRGTPVSENRAWGFFNVWRQPKRALQQIKPFHSPIAKLELKTSRDLKDLEVVIVPRPKGDLPSYALRDYRIAWEFRRRDGGVAGSDSMHLPIPLIMRFTYGQMVLRLPQH